jgi:DNA polymerase
VTTLARAAADCHGCELYEDATQTVFGAGARTAVLMLVGEQPGDVEDERGEPFVGPAGRVLDRALLAAAIERDEVYLTNAVKHFHFRRAGKRRLHQTPRVAHVNACRPWVIAEIGVVRPQVVVCMGATATRSILGTDVKVMRDRGAVLERDTAPGRFVVTIHPSAVLRAEDRRAEVFDGLVADLRTAVSAVPHR